MEQSEKLVDSEIIARVLQGEKSLYELIVRRFNPYLYKIGRSYHYNHEDTQDLMQETFIDAYKNLIQFEGRANFKTWIIRIMMNNCFRKRKQSGFYHEELQDVHEYSTPMFHNTHNNTEKLIQNRELGHIIEEALLKIPIDYRIVFSLREINGLSVSETADLLKITETNVKVRLSRAKIMLRNEMITAYSTVELFEFNLKYCDTMVERVMEKIREY